MKAKIQKVRIEFVNFYILLFFFVLATKESTLEESTSTLPSALSIKNLQSQIHYRMIRGPRGIQSSITSTATSESTTQGTESISNEFGSALVEIGQTWTSIEGSNPQPIQVFRKPTANAIDATTTKSSYERQFTHSFNSANQTGQIVILPHQLREMIDSKIERNKAALGMIPSQRKPPKHLIQKAKKMQQKPAAVVEEQPKVIEPPENKSKKRRKKKNSLPVKRKPNFSQSDKSRLDCLSKKLDLDKVSLCV